jgi:hypothetical protein
MLSVLGFLTMNFMINVPGNEGNRLSRIERRLWSHIWLR